jgi:helix-turn-helix protein
MGDLSDSAQSVLEGYIRETDLARQLNRSVRTLQRLAARRSGPPRIKIGRLIFYRIDSVRAWLGSKKRSQSPTSALLADTSNVPRRIIADSVSRSSSRGFTRFVTPRTWFAGDLTHKQCTSVRNPSNHVERT